MRSSRLRKSFLSSPQDEDLISPLAQNQNRSSLKQKQKLSQDIKSKYIQQLQQRNRKLKYQILKINQILDQHTLAKESGKKKQHRLIPNETSAQVLRKQLQNVYKLIKNYQHQINQLQTKHSGGLITDKMARMQTILSQKNKHFQKLKSQLTKLTKQSIDNSKKLKDNYSKERVESVLLKYNDQIKVLRERVRNNQEKERKKIQNAKKQYQYIKKLQRQLMENGVPMDQIQQLKKNNIYIQIYDKLNNPDKQQFDTRNAPLNKSKITKIQTKQEIQDMTIDRFMELKNQGKLYQKLHQDYQKKLTNLQKQKAQQQKLTQVARRKLEQRQKQIAQAQAQVAELKTKMRNMNLKANYQPPKQQLTTKKQKPKMPVTKLKQNAQQIKSLGDQTHIKFDQKGQISAKGQRFTDREVIGKTTSLKINSLKIWTQKTSNTICGLQLSYLINQVAKPGQQHISKQTKKYCTQNKMQLSPGDYIKAISGHLSPNNIIQYLVFISNKAVIGRFGVAKPTQKQFNFDIEDDQLPICMYGSLLNTNLMVNGEKKELTILEQLGFQITTDKSYEKDPL